MTLTFFGTDADIAQIWRAIFDTPRMKIFEDYSLPGKPNRWYSTWADVAEALAGNSITLAAWLASAGGEPRIEHIAFDAKTAQHVNATGRSVLRSPATIKVRTNSKQDGCLASSSISCSTEKGARQRSVFPAEFIDRIDWTQLRLAVGKIERSITRSSPAKMRSNPVMPDAFEAFVKGDLRLWNWGEACAYPSPLVVRL